MKGLRKLRQRDLALLLIALTALLAVLWYVYLFRPATARIAQLEGEITQLGADIRVGEIARDNIAQLQAELERLELEKAAFLAELPLESEVASLIDQLRLGAEGAGVGFGSISKGGGSGEQIQGVRPIGFSVATEGSYPSTMGFMNILEGLQRFTKIQRVGFTVDEQGVEDPMLSTNYDFTVYVYTGETLEASAEGAP